MKKLVASVAALSLSASVAFAGGPVVVVEEGQPEVVQQQSSSSVGALPILIGLVLLCDVACGGGSDDPQRGEEPLD